MTAGSALRRARERAGISAEQISDLTKIQLYKIVALERDDYSQLPQGIYLDGIVRAYAHEVGIDPEPVVERVRAERGKLPGDWEVPFAAPIDLHPAQAHGDIPPLDEIPVLAPSSDDDALDGFATESDLDVAPVTRGEYQAVVASQQPEPPPRAEPPLSIEPVRRVDPPRRAEPSRPPAQARAPEPPPAPEPLPVRREPVRREYVAPGPNLAADVPLDADLPLDSDLRRDFDPPPVTSSPRTLPPPQRGSSHRSGVLLPILILLAAAGLGMYFYEAARALDRREITQETAEPGTDARRNANADTAPVAPEARADAPVPFSENVITPDDRRRDAPDANASAVPRDTPGSSDSPIRPERTVPTAGSRPAPPDNRPTAAPTATPAAPPAATTARTENPDKSATPASLPDVTGSWRLATQIESSSYSKYEGLKLGYEMQLEQDGDRITGTGRKITENGSGVRGKAQTPVTVNGTINGDRLTLNFVERGARRATQGKFVLLLEEDGRLRGRFSSDAARSSGLAEAQRVQ